MILLDAGEGPVIFSPVISDVPSDDAVELWRHVSWLGRYENFTELKHDRIHPPDLSAVAWYRSQREADWEGCPARDGEPSPSASHPLHA